MSYKKNCTRYFFNDIIKIKKFKIDEKSCKTILIYHIGYMTVKELN